MKSQNIQNQLNFLFSALQIPKPTLEHRFHPKRRFRFDYAWPDFKIALEYEGIFSAKSRHTSIKGFTKDCTKYNLAAIDGWIVIRVTAIHLEDNTALEYLGNAFLSRPDKLDPRVRVRLMDMLGVSYVGERA